MKVTVVGVGAMGTAVAQGLAASGAEVVVTFSRDPERIAAVAAEVGAVVLPPAEAARGADAVVVTVSPDGLEPALAALGDLSGQVVVSVTSGLVLDPTGQTFGLPTDRPTSIAHVVAAAAPGARVVQALSTTFGPVLATGAASLPERPTVAMCGDDPAAKAVTADLVRALGADPLDLGPLALAPVLETFATASAQLAIASGLAPMFAVRLLTPAG